jgi:hypothetical protein
VHAIVKLRAAILERPDEGWRTRYGGHGTEEVVGDADVADLINVPGHGTGSGA